MNFTGEFAEYLIKFAYHANFIYVLITSIFTLVLLRN